MRVPISLRRLFARHAKPERPLHEVERRMAKEYIKRRLAFLYPELRTDPDALERAYQELGLESTGVVRVAGSEVQSFALSLSGGMEGRLDQV